ncbi:MAG TPA: UDP-N-acetylmuramoyl-L-alanine--D-glutamate ligase [Pseudogracilibacillus sp.]|nr:UDP-N-acetylmuramoyl-L-alanine--D-glutamate ligase [Pseudogracilibacillus sp.]
MRQLTHFPYKRILVLGLAKSGTAAAELLLDHQCFVRVNDYSSSREEAHVQHLIQQGAEVILGSHPLSALEDIELIVKNPGIPYENVLLVEAQNKNIPIITEIELAGQLAPEQSIIGITGSNGKTTTTTLVEEMLRASECPVKLAGNIGTAATEVAQTLEEEDNFLLELSSFQLMGIQNFRPHVAALLNVHAAHLDYHGSMENYVKAKANIIQNQTADDYFVYNMDDANVAQIAKYTKADLVGFTTHQQHVAGAWMDEVNIYFYEERIISREDVQLVGNHNLENIAAAIAIALTAGGSVDGVKRVLQTFSGVKHRLQYVKEVENRFFYNDSKATNMLATEKALQAFKQPTILLAGGLDRGDDFRELIPFLTHVKAMVVFGETKEKLQLLAEELNICVEASQNMEEAVKTAYHLSSKKDVILLSPACASWDQYKTFEERGNLYIQAVETL